MLYVQKSLFSEPHVINSKTDSPIAIFLSKVSYWPNSHALKRNRLLSYSVSKLYSFILIFWSPLSVRHTWRTCRAAQFTIRWRVGKRSFRTWQKVRHGVIRSYYSKPRGQEKRLHNDIPIVATFTIVNYNSFLFRIVGIPWRKKLFFLEKKIISSGITKFSLLTVVELILLLLFIAFSSHLLHVIWLQFFCPIATSN